MFSLLNRLSDSDTLCDAGVLRNTLFDPWLSSYHMRCFGVYYVIWNHSKAHASPCLSFPLRMRACVWMVFSTIFVACYIWYYQKHKIIPISCRTQQLIAYHYIDIIIIIANCSGLLFARLTMYTYTTKTSNDVNMFAARCPFLIGHIQV